MQGRVKPRFEDLANAALQKPTLIPPPTVLLPPPDHTAAISQFRNMSHELGNNQYDAASLLARAQQIAQQTGTPAEVALQAMSREQSDAAASSQIGAVSAQARVGQERLAQLNADRFYGQTLLQYKNNSRIQDVARQVRVAHTNPFEQLALASAGGSASAAAATPAEAAVLANNDAAAATAVPGDDDVDMSLRPPSVFESSAPNTLKSYTQIRQELAENLAKAAQGDASPLWSTIETFGAWVSMNQATPVFDDQVHLLTLVLGLGEAGNSAEAAVAIGQILAILDMDTSSQVINKIASYWNRQIEIVPSERNRGRNPPDGSDRTLKPKTSMAKFRAALTAVGSKRDKDKQVRQDQVQRRRGSAASSGPVLVGPDQAIVARSS